jgi:CLIP-associating protein 1/2
MTREHNILFRAHVPSLVAALEDADSGVRETAKTTIIEIFQCVVVYPVSFRRIH